MFLFCSNQPGRVKDAMVTISIDNRGRCVDNIFIARPWRPLKEAIYLHEMSDGFVAERIIGK